MKLVILRNDEEIIILAENDVNVICLCEAADEFNPETITVGKKSYIIEPYVITIGKKAVLEFNRIATTDIEKRVIELEKEFMEIEKNVQENSAARKRILAELDDCRNKLNG